MDGKRRRSSLRKSIYARDENAAVSCTPRGQRRISFSGKHLVREFHREEEPKTWENSYEISDHLNADEIGSKLSMSQNASFGQHSMFQCGNGPSSSKYFTDIADENNALCIENSVNVTLFENEKQCFVKNQKHFEDANITNKTTNINSFSLNEYELLALPTLRLNILGERTIDFMKDVRRETCQLNDRKNDAHEIPTDDDDCIGVTVFSEYMHEADYVKFTYNENKNGREAVTIFMNDSLSTSNAELNDSETRVVRRKTLKTPTAMDFSPDFDKENVHPAISSDANITSNTSRFMDIENCLDLSNTKVSLEKESKEFQEKLDRISFSTNCNDNSHMILTRDDLNAEEKATQRPTINFYQHIENSPINPDNGNIRKSINSHDDMNLSTNYVNISERARKNGRPSKLVVRKICTPLTSKSNNAIDLDKQRLRYKMKQEMDHLPNIDVVSLPISPNSNQPKTVKIPDVPVLENSLNFSLSSAKDISLSPETSSSLLIPSEYKTYNFKQLNDEFECGKIQLFSKTNTVERKPKEYHRITSNNFPELAKQRKTLFFEEDITPDHSLRENCKSSERGANVRCRFSQADDLMLDNTSFLARAKLGDETTSRNSTKRDITNLIDGDIFDETSRQSGNQLMFLATKPKDENKSNLSLHSMFKDTEPDFRNFGTNKKDNDISLFNNDSSLREFESGLACNVPAFSKNHENRQTILLNEDIDSEKNKDENTNDCTHLIQNKKSLRTYKSTKGLTFYRHDDIELGEFTDALNKDMELDGEIMPHILENKCTPVSDKITSNLVQSSLRVNSEESKLLRKNNLHPSGYIIDILEERHKEGYDPQRKTIFFDNESIRSMERSTENLDTESYLAKKASVQHFTDKSDTERVHESSIDKAETFGKNNLHPSGYIIDILEERHKEGYDPQRKTIFFDNESIRSMKRSTENLDTESYLAKKASVQHFTDKSDTERVHESSIDKAKTFGIHTLQIRKCDTISNQTFQDEIIAYSEIVEKRNIREDVDNNIRSSEIFKPHARKTIYFNQNIQTDNLPNQPDENSDEYIGNLEDNFKSLTKMRHVYCGISLNDVNVSNRENELFVEDNSIKIANGNVSNAPYKTFQLNHEIVEMDLCESIQKSNEDKEAIDNCLETEKDSEYRQNKMSTTYPTQFSDDTKTSSVQHFTNKSDTERVQASRIDKAKKFGNHSLQISEGDTISNQTFQHKTTSESDRKIVGKRYIREDLDNNKRSSEISKPHARKTIYFNQNIQTDNLQNQADEYIGNLEENVKSLTKMRQVYCDMSLNDANISIKIANDVSNTPSKTFPLIHEIVEVDLCESTRKSNEDEEEIHNCLETEKDVEYRQTKRSTRYPTYFNAHEMKANYFSNNDHGEIVIEKTNEVGGAQFQKNEDIEPKDVYHTAMYTNNKIDEEIISLHDNIACKENDVYVKDHSKENIKYHQNENVVPLNESITLVDQSSCSAPTALNAAKLTLARQRHGNNSTANKYESFIHKDKYLNTTPDDGLVNKERVFEMTPRLSLNEFLAYEKRMENSADKDIAINDKQYKSPVQNEISNKRMSVNLTPLLSVSKKRHTLVFMNCDMDESMPVYHNRHKKKGMEDEKCQNTDMNNHMDTSVTMSREPVLQTPSKQRKSRIPVPLSSGKKSNVSSLHRSADQIGDFDEVQRSELICEEDANCTQSIPEIRRATTFDHKHNSFVELKLKSQATLEFQQTGQRLLFEDNPITISDVSLYFQAQRSGVADNCDMINAVTEEMKGKSFQKRYLNLTCGSELEDIDQTRLCLVGTLSDEDADECDTNMEKSDLGDISYPQSIATTQIKTAATNDYKNKRSVYPQSRNLSTMCRKCKRCQETFINETTSSLTDSFVLPSLPPVPALDLGRLRRIRSSSLKISDANLLWHRASLDRTIINFGDDSKTFSIFKDCADGDYSFVVTPIQKYLNHIQRFKIDVESQIYKSHSITQSLISRIDDLFRIHSPNWIFDNQLQYVGVMLFINKTISTFSLILTYDENDSMGKEIQLKTVKLEKINIENWKPLDFILDFQLKLNLPFDLLSLCDSSNEFGIFKMLQKIDKVCLETNRIGTELQRIVFINWSTIIRDEHRTFVRKFVRKPVSTFKQYERVEKVEFRIEILNIKKLCFRDITMPSLYNFCEDIHILPVGLEFLNQFLQNPLRYLKDC